MVYCVLLDVVCRAWEYCPPLVSHTSSNQQSLISHTHTCTCTHTHRVVFSVPILAENFWEEVASLLGTGHGATECSRQYAHFRKKHTKSMGAGGGREGSCTQAHGESSAAVLDHVLYCCTVLYSTVL